MAANSASRDEILWTEKIGEGESDLSVFFKTAQADFFSDVKQLFNDQKKKEITNKTVCGV